MTNTPRPTSSDFLRERIGSSNWVLARRTPAIEARYGADVVCVSRKLYAAIEREYRTLYGAPYDDVRAELYLQLRQARDVIAAAGGKVDRIDAALAAEVAA